MNIYQKFALAGAGAVLGLSAIAVNSSQAATFSFAQKDVQGIFDLITGSFSGEDINNNGYIDLEELANFSVTVDVPNSFVFDLDLEDIYFYTPYELGSGYLSNYGGASEVGSVIGTGAWTFIYYLGEFQGGALGTIAVQEVEENPPTSVPEPSLIFALGAIATGGLLKKKLKSSSNR